MIIELRHYVPAAGKAERLAGRFQNHVVPLMQEYDITLIDLFVDRSGNGETWCLVEWTSETAMEQGWEKFRADTRWQTVKRESETDGALVATSRSYTLQRPNQQQEV